MNQQTRRSLVQIMACRLFSAKQYPKECRLLVNRYLGTNSKQTAKFKSNTTVFVSKVSFDTVVWKMTVMLERHHCVNVESLCSIWTIKVLYWCNWFIGPFVFYRPINSPISFIGYWDCIHRPLAVVWKQWGCSPAYIFIVMLEVHSLSL